MAETTPPPLPGSLGVIGRAWEMVKHVGLTALKWGAIGAVAVGLPLALMSGTVGMATFGLASSMLPSLMTSLGIGAAAVAAIPTLSSLFSAGQAADDAEALSQDVAAREEARQRQQVALNTQGPNLGGNPLSPNVPNQPRGQQPGAVGAG